MALAMLDKYATDPDFLPPDPRWGTTADFAAFVAQAHAHGDLVIGVTPEA